MALLAAQLNKPVDYFLANFITQEFNLNEQSPQEKEMIMLYRGIPNNNLRQIAINQLNPLQITLLMKFNSKIFAKDNCLINNIIRTDFINYCYY